MFPPVWFEFPFAVFWIERVTTWLTFVLLPDADWPKALDPDEWIPPFPWLDWLFPKEELDLPWISFYWFDKFAFIIPLYAFTMLWLRAFINCLSPLGPLWCWKLFYYKPPEFSIDTFLFRCFGVGWPWYALDLGIALKSKTTVCFCIIWVYLISVKLLFSFVLIWPVPLDKFGWWFLEA